MIPLLARAQRILQAIPKAERDQILRRGRYNTLQFQKPLNLENIDQPTIQATNWTTKNNPHVHVHRALHGALLARNVRRAVEVAGSFKGRGDEKVGVFEAATSRGERGGGGSEGCARAMRAGRAAVTRWVKYFM